MEFLVEIQINFEWKSRAEIHIDFHWNSEENLMEMKSDFPSKFNQISRGTSNECFRGNSDDVTEEM